MRQSTANRLLALLEQEHAKLKAYTEADILGDYGKKEREINELFQEWRGAGNQAQREELFARVEVAKVQRDKLWRAYNKQFKNLEANVKEQHALQWDIDDLRSLLLSAPLRP